MTSDLRAQGRRSLGRRSIRPSSTRSTPARYGWVRGPPSKRARACARVTAGYFCGAVTRYTFLVMTSFEAVLDQALKLSDEERSKVAASLLNSLEPEDGEELSLEEWDGAWSAELDKRLREISIEGGRP